MSLPTPCADVSWLVATDAHVCPRPGAGLKDNLPSHETFKAMQQGCAAEMCAAAARCINATLGSEEVAALQGDPLAINPILETSCARPPATAVGCGKRALLSLRPRSRSACTSNLALPC